MHTIYRPTYKFYVHVNIKSDEFDVITTAVFPVFKQLLILFFNNILALTAYVQINIVNSLMIKIWENATTVVTVKNK